MVFRAHEVQDIEQSVVRERPQRRRPRERDVPDAQAPGAAPFSHAPPSCDTSYATDVLGGLAPPRDILRFLAATSWCGSEIKSAMFIYTIYSRAVSPAPIPYSTAGVSTVLSCHPPSGAKPCSLTPHALMPLPQLRPRSSRRAAFLVEPSLEAGVPFDGQVLYPAQAAPGRPRSRDSLALPSLLFLAALEVRVEASRNASRVSQAPEVLRILHHLH